MSPKNVMGHFLIFSFWLAFAALPSVPCAEPIDQKLLPVSTKFSELMKLGKQDEAHQLLLDAEKTHPEEPQIQRFLAISDKVRGNLEGAIQRLTIHRNNMPNDFFGRELLLDFLLFKKDFSTHQKEREALVNDYNKLKEVPYYRGNYRFPREYFSVSDAIEEFGATVINVNGFEHYGDGLLTGRDAATTRPYHFDLIRPDGSYVGFILLATNKIENDTLKEMGEIKDNTTSYSVRFYEGTSGSTSKLLTFIVAKNTPTFEAARQVVINFVKGRPFEQDIEKWLADNH